MTETLESAPSSAEATLNAEPKSALPQEAAPPAPAIADAKPAEKPAEKVAEKAAEPAARKSLLGEAGKKAETAKPADQWELKAPEGQTFDGRVIGAFEKGARAAGLDNAKAQSLLDEVAPVMAAQARARVEQLYDDWHAEVVADKDIAGADGTKLDENLGAIKSTIEKFGGPEALKLILGEDGLNPLGVNKTLLRMVLNFHKSISDDTVIPGTGSGGEANGYRAMYPNSPELV
jgi:hypothetical protein